MPSGHQFLPQNQIWEQEFLLGPTPSTKRNNKSRSSQPLSSCKGIGTEAQGENLQVMKGDNVTIPTTAREEPKICNPPPLKRGTQKPQVAHEAIKLTIPKELSYYFGWWQALQTMPFPFQLANATEGRCQHREQRQVTPLKIPKSRNRARIPMSFQEKRKILASAAHIVN